jgi:hypothetical protein
LRRGGGSAVPMDVRPAAVASVDVNQVKNRLQALGLLDRAFGNASDDDLAAAIDVLDDDHREGLDELLDDEIAPASIRASLGRGRIDGTMEGVALILSDACLADCIEQLGDHADYPSTEQLQEVLPGLVEEHGLAITQLMLASTVVGDAPAAAIIRDLLKNDDLVKLPPAEPRPISPIVQRPVVSDDERAAIKAKRKELRQKKQAAARAAREQAAKAKRR